MNAVTVMDNRSRLLRVLLHHRDEGRTLDELGAALGISRSAVQQHVVALERDGLVSVHEERPTGGRPSRVYGLTEAGHESFPRHYALLGARFLEHAREAFGDEGVERVLERMADGLAEELEPRLAGKRDGARRAEVLAVMNELGYDAAPLEGRAGIAAVNCIYHRLARQTRAVCRFDVRLLSALLGRELDHAACMADGDGRCTFLERADAAAPDAER